MFSINPLIYVLLVLAGMVRGSQLSNIEKLLNISRYEAPNWDSPDLTYMNNFEELTVISYTGQQNFTVQANESSLLYYSNDTFVKLFETSPETTVTMIVPLFEDSFILSGTGQINGVALEQQILLNLTSLTTSPIFPSAVENVMDILTVNETVIFVGNFSMSVSNETGHGAVLWDVVANTTELFPFKGFGENSIVNSVVKLNSDNILFAGSFQEIQNASLLQEFGNATNSSHEDLTSLQFDQSVPLKLSSITGENVQSDILLCPSGGQNGWSASEAVQSTLQFDLKNEIHPSKVRIYNSVEENSEISLFRIITGPSNGIMNLTYLDPASGELKQCDAWCPLLSIEDLTQISQNSTAAPKSVGINNNSTNLKWSESYQEFAFVNDIPVTMLQFVALASYGSNAALHSIEIFETEFMVYANNSYNEPNCESVTEYSKAELSSDNWYTTDESDTYISTNIDDNIPYVTFHPNITYPGRYTFNIYTPGCLQDNSCSKRGIVNVTMIDRSINEVLASVLIYQTNNEDKFDPLYTGSLGSAPEIIVTWDKAIGESDSVMVVDRLGVITEYIDTISISSNDTTFHLNGLFQYNTANVTASIFSTNDTFNDYALYNFPLDANLYAASLNNDILIGGNFNGIAKVELNDEALISSSQKLGTSGYTTGIFEYSNGLLLSGTYQVENDSRHEILSYDGNAFNSFGQLDEPIDRIVNFTIDGHELLLFDNAYIFNVSANMYVSNSSTFEITGQSAGINSGNDSLLFGSFLKRSVGELNGLASLSSDGQVSSPTLPELPTDVQPYKAAYINDTSAAYALQEGSTDNVQHRVLITNTNSSSHMLQIQWSAPINAFLYDNVPNILAIGTNGSNSSSQYDVQFSILNLTGYENVARVNFSTNERVNSMVSFSSNNSILVGGSYEIDNCNDLCLYNYQTKEWTSFLNDSITGDIRQMQFADEGKTLLVGGLIKTNNESNIQLLSVEVGSNIFSTVKSGTEPLLSFVPIDDSTDNIIAQMNSEILRLESGTWSSFGPKLNNDSIVSGFKVLSGTESKKRDEGSHIVLLEGTLNSSEWGNLTSVVYDGSTQKWQPYFVISDPKEQESLPSSSFFQNVNDLYLSSSQTVLQSNNSDTSASSTPTPSTTSSSHSTKDKKIDRGFIVLIGLALALATVAVIGLIGALICYFFINNNGYESLKPRINQDEMLDTVPPEKLMKFI